MDGINESIDLETVHQENELAPPPLPPPLSDNDKENRTDDESGSELGSNSGRKPQANEPIDFTKSTEYKDLIQEVQGNLLCAVGIQLKNSSALIRRVIVLLLEFLGTTNLNIDQLLTSYVSIF